MPCMGIYLSHVYTGGSARQGGKIFFLGYLSSGYLVWVLVGHGSDRNGQGRIFTDILGREKPRKIRLF